MPPIHPAADPRLRRHYFLRLLLLEIAVLRAPEVGVFHPAACPAAVARLLGAVWAICCAALLAALEALRSPAAAGCLRGSIDGKHAEQGQRKAASNYDFHDLSFLLSTERAKPKPSASQEFGVLASGPVWCIPVTSRRVSPGLHTSRELSG